MSETPFAGDLPGGFPPSQAAASDAADRAPGPILPRPNRPLGPPGWIPKVLIAEDSPSIRSTIVMTLRTIGVCDIVDVPDGYTALDAIEAAGLDGLDLVVTDIRMPRVSGLSVVRIARRANPVAPIVVQTVVETGMTQEAALRLGASDYLVKPFTIIDLEKRLRFWLRQAAQFAGGAGQKPPSEQETVPVESPESVPPPRSPSQSPVIL